MQYDYSKVMEENMKRNGKIVCIVQARMSSSRLPGKSFKDICGKPVLQRVIERVSRSMLLSDVWLACSEHYTDNILEKFAEVAKNNPLADRRQGYSAKDISDVNEQNPYIGFPYTKLMNANAFIDQSSAIIMTTVKHAKELGINRNKWVYLHGCADTYDHWYLSDRINYYSSPAMKIACNEALKMANCAINDIDFLDIYSCFPSAIKIACDEMNIDINTNKDLTVTGGLPYFGGPGNNYVTHSISEIMHKVRNNIGAKGLVTANGNYITKQSVGIYSSEQPSKMFAPTNPSLYQAKINKDKGPSFIEEANGNAYIETYTVINDREGPSFSILFGRLNDGSRFIANTPNDKDLLLDMMAKDYLNIRGKVQNNNEIVDPLDDVSGFTGTGWVQTSGIGPGDTVSFITVSYTHLRAHEPPEQIGFRVML